MRNLRGFVALFGAEELLLLLALGLCVAGLWPIIGQRALLVPGAVLLWIALPSRAPLVARPAVEKPPRRRV